MSSIEEALLDTPYSVEDIDKFLKYFGISIDEVYEATNVKKQKGMFILNTQTFANVIEDWFSDVIKATWEANNDLYIINFGREGSGKSLFSIWFAYHLSKRLGVPFDVINNISLTHEEWLKHQATLSKQFEIYDEAEDSFDVQKFQQVEGRTAKTIAIRNRIAKNINILNYPHLRYMHPYIREERMDFVFYNAYYKVKDSEGRSKTIYAKFIFNKEEAFKLISEYVRNPNLTEKELIGNFMKKKKWTYVIGGIFWLDKEKEKEVFDIFSKYSVRKDWANELIKSSSFTSEVIGKNKYRLLEDYRGETFIGAFSLILTFALLIDLIMLSTDFKEYQYTLSLPKKERKERLVRYGTNLFLMTQDGTFSNVLLPLPLIKYYLSIDVFEEALHKLYKDYYAFSIRNKALNVLTSVYYKVPLNKIKALKTLATKINLKPIKEFFLEEDKIKERIFWYAKVEDWLNALELFNGVIDPHQKLEILNQNKVSSKFQSGYFITDNKLNQKIVANWILPLEVLNDIIYNIYDENLEVSLKEINEMYIKNMRIKLKEHGLNKTIVNNPLSKDKEVVSIHYFIGALKVFSNL